MRSRLSLRCGVTTVRKAATRDAGASGGTAFWRMEASGMQGSVGPDCWSPLNRKKAIFRTGSARIKAIHCGLSPRSRPVMTFKQLEAIYWVARLGGFAQAATKLHTTQSAISKRVQELESLFDTPLFDRTLRTARLTDKGEEMFAVAQRLLGQRDTAVEQFLRPEVIERRLRLGVTELTAMTWLPRLVQRIESFYPKVVIEP